MKFKYLRYIFAAAEHTRLMKLIKLNYPMGPLQTAGPPTRGPIWLIHGLVRPFDSYE